ncbi:MAG: hypothetical protein ACOC5E_00130 [Acidobacteriota bacterium]
MFFNAAFFVHFVLFLVFLIGTFQGATILKTRTFESPVGQGGRVEGRAAVLTGAALLAVGLMALAAMVVMLLLI